MRLSTANGVIQSIMIIGAKALRRKGKTENGKGTVTLFSDLLLAPI